jgi:c(7)-type cytochrome triheme protein
MRGDGEPAPVDERQIKGNRMRSLGTFWVIMSTFLIAGIAYADQVGGGDLTFSPQGAAPVVFSHELHVVKHGLKCSGCHYQIFEMAKGSYKMEMGKITKGDFCGKCHNGQKAFDVKEKESCIRCHHVQQQEKN